MTDIVELQLTLTEDKNFLSLKEQYDALNVLERFFRNQLIFSLTCYVKSNSSQTIFLDKFRFTGSSLGCYFNQFRIEYLELDSIVLEENKIVRLTELTTKQLYELLEYIYNEYSLNKNN